MDSNSAIRASSRVRKSAIMKDDYVYYVVEKKAKKAAAIETKQKRNSLPVSLPTAIKNPPLWTKQSIVIKEPKAKSDSPDPQQKRHASRETKSVSPSSPSKTIGVRRYNSAMSFDFDDDDDDGTLPLSYFFPPPPFPQGPLPADWSPASDADHSSSRNSSVSPPPYLHSQVKKKKKSPLPVEKMKNDGKRKPKEEEPSSIDFDLAISALMEVKTTLKERHPDQMKRDDSPTLQEESRSMSPQCGMQSPSDYFTPLCLVRGRGRPRREQMPCRHCFLKFSTKPALAAHEKECKKTDVREESTPQPKASSAIAAHEKECKKTDVREESTAQPMAKAVRRPASPSLSPHEPSPPQKKMKRKRSVDTVVDDFPIADAYLRTRRSTRIALTGCPDFAAMQKNSERRVRVEGGQKEGVTKPAWMIRKKITVGMYESQTLDISFRCKECKDVFPDLYEQAIHYFRNHLKAKDGEKWPECIKCMDRIHKEDELHTHIVEVYECRRHYAEPVVEGSDLVGTLPEKKKDKNGLLLEKFGPPDFHLGSKTVYENMVRDGLVNPRPERFDTPPGEEEEGDQSACNTDEEEEVEIEEKENMDAALEEDKEMEEDDDEIQIIQVIRGTKKVQEKKKKMKKRDYIYNRGPREWQDKYYGVIKEHWFACPFCDIRYQSFTGIGTHILKFHRDQKLNPYSCVGCKEQFRCPHNLQQHMRARCPTSEVIIDRSLMKKIPGPPDFLTEEEIAWRLSEDYTESEEESESDEWTTDDDEEEENTAVYAVDSHTV